MSYVEQSEKLTRDIKQVKGERSKGIEAVLDARLGKKVPGINYKTIEQDIRFRSLLGGEHRAIPKAVNEIRSANNLVSLPVLGLPLFWHPDRRRRGGPGRR